MQKKCRQELSNHLVFKNDKKFGTVLGIGNFNRTVQYLSHDPFTHIQTDSCPFSLIFCRKIRVKNLIEVFRFYTARTVTHRYNQCIFFELGE